MPNRLRSHEHADKRQSERFIAKNPLIVSDFISNTVLGSLANISRDGLMLLGEREIKEGGVYQVTIAVDHCVAEDELALGIECLWTSAAGTGGSQWSGFRIIDISDANQKILKDLISQLE